MIRPNCEMPEVTVKASAIEFDEEKILRSLGLKEDALRPASVTVSAPYASAMEFGTQPASRMGPARIHAFRKSDGSVFYDEVSDSFWELYLWAQRHATQLEPYDFARTVHSKIMKEGLKPHPYIRPALIDLMDEGITDVLKERGSLYGVAEWVAERMAENLENGVGDSAQSDTGELARSISVQYSDGAPTDDSGYDLELDGAGGDWSGRR